MDALGPIAIAGPESCLRCHAHPRASELLVGFTSAPGDCFVTVRADNDVDIEVPTHTDAAGRARYVELSLEDPAGLVELRFSTECHVSLVAFRH